MLSDLLGIEQLTNSFGLLIVSRGLASLVGTPLAGCVFDLSNSYGATFLSAGLMFVVAGILGVGISFAHRHQRSLYKNEGKCFIQRFEVIFECFCQNPIF